MGKPFTMVLLCENIQLTLMVSPSIATELRERTNNVVMAIEESLERTGLPHGHYVVSPKGHT